MALWGRTDIEKNNEDAKYLEVFAVREVVEDEKEQAAPEGDKGKHRGDEPGGATLLLRGGMGDAEDVDEGSSEEAEGIHGWAPGLRFGNDLRMPDNFRSTRDGGTEFWSAQYCKDGAIRSPSKMGVVVFDPIGWDFD